MALTVALLLLDDEVVALVRTKGTFAERTDLATFFAASLGGTLTCPLVTIFLPERALPLLPASAVFRCAEDMRANADTVRSRCFMVKL